MNNNKSKPLGFYANKTQQLIACKQDFRQTSKINRFQKECKTTSSSSRFSVSTNNSFCNGKKNTECLLQKNEGTLKMENDFIYIIEMNSSPLPPTWVDCYEFCISNLKQLDSILDKISIKGRERINNGFSDHTKIDAEINELTKFSNQLIRECGQHLSEIERLAGQQIDSDSEYLILRNAKASLTQRISEATIRLRNQQQMIYDMFKKFNIKNLEYLPSTISTEDSEHSQQHIQNNHYFYSEIVRERQQNIDQIAEQIKELSDIYKTLGLLVIDQGTLLDRIDVNIMQTRENIKHTNKHLSNVSSVQESKFSTSIIKVLLTLITFFTVILMLRYSA